MIRIKTLVGSSMLLALAMVTTHATASVFYLVGDSVSNCNSGGPNPHGLWTAGSTLGGMIDPTGGNGCGEYFRTTTGTFVINDGPGPIVASLEMNVTNDDGVTAVVDLDFSEFAETHYPYKRENGAPYDPGTNDIVDVLAAPGNGDIDFFRSVLGTITFSRIGFADVAVNIDAFEIAANLPGDPEHAFQFGDGANAKNANVFGASAWIIGDGGLAGGAGALGHWDLNLNLTADPNPPPNVTPEPASMALMGLGLLAAGRIRRRRA